METLLSLQSLMIAFIWIGWIQDQEKHGNSGTGLKPNQEHGQCGDISTITSMVELGSGLPINPMETVGIYDQSYVINHLSMGTVKIYYQSYVINHLLMGTVQIYHQSYIINHMVSIRFQWELSRYIINQPDCSIKTLNLKYFIYLLLLILFSSFQCIFNQYCFTIFNLFHNFYLWSIYHFVIKFT